MATIVTKNSSTASAVPTTSDLVKGELAVNVTDKRIFTENASAAIVELGTNPSTITTTTATVSGTLTANGTFASSNAVVTGGTINSTPIGATTASTVRGSTVTATTGFVGGLTGNVVGNVTGNVTGNITGVVTGNVTGNVTGDVTGNITASSGTSTFTNVTINGGLDMNAGTSATITNLASPTNTNDAATKGYVDTADATKLNLSGGTMSGAIAMGAAKITGLADPTAAQDAATKIYVDNSVQGLDAKASCRAGTTANITLSGAQTIDGVSVIAGDRVLVKDQTSAAENGIYVAAASGWARSADANTWDELVNAYSFVEDGTANANNGFVASIVAGGTLGSTAVTWVQFSGAGQVIAGAGMTKSGNTLDVGTAAASRIVVNADNIDLATSGVTAATYRSVTTDAYGRITGGTNPTTVSGYGLTDVFTKTEINTSLATKLNLTGGTMSGAIAMGTNKITGAGDPTAAQDVATKAYTDSILGSATSAATSAAAAATSASNASTSASGAATSATNAGNSATAAASSAAAAATTYDNFDDRYLGDKSSDPTVDNDGNALLTGALYFNTGSNAMKVYSGSAWGNVAPTATSINLASQVTGTLPVANGGTGATTLTANNVLLGNGTSAPQAVAPSTAGNVLTSNGSTWQSTAPSGGGLSVDFVATGTLASGQAVALKTDGTVSAIVGITGAEATFEAAESKDINSEFDPDTGKIVVAYTDTGDSNLGKAVVGTVSGNAISFGSATTFSGSSDGRKPQCVYDTNANKMVILFWDNAGNRGKAIVGTVSGTSISFGTVHEFNNDDIGNLTGAFDSDTNKVIAVFSDSGNSSYGTAVPLTVSGTGISGTTKTVYNSASTVYQGAVYDTSADRLLIAYGNGNDSGHGYAIAGALSGSSYTFGSAVEFEGAQIEETNAVFDATNNKTLVGYKDVGNSGAVTGCVISLSGSTVSVGTPVVISTNNVIDEIGLAYNPDTGKILVVWRGSNGYANEVQISGTSLTAGSDAQWMSGSDASRFPYVSYDTSADKYAIFFSDFDDNTGNGFVYLGGPANTDFIGITEAAISNSATGKITVLGGINDKLTSLTIASDYYVQTDGTLSTTVSSVPAGRALSATSILLKGLS